MFKKTLAATAFWVAMQAVPASAELVFGVTENQSLVSFQTDSPGNLRSGAVISGLQENETVLGVDFRPANGQLYALGSTSRLYTLNTNSGVATEVGAGPFTPPISGANFGFDFNPVIDRIRLDSDVNTNSVLNPNDGTATRVTDLFYNTGDVNEGRDPNVVHAAYDNNVDGATRTQLYGIDTGLDTLVTQANSAGTLETVGALPVDIGSVGGFDISGDTGAAFITVQATDESVSSLWTIDLSSGAASRVGEIGGGLVLTSFSVAPANLTNAAVPEPTALALTGATAGLATLRRRR